MKAHTFDTLSYANKLKAVGVAPEIAETHAEINSAIMASFIEYSLSLKQEMDHMKIAAQENFEKIRIFAQDDLKRHDSEVKQELRSFRIEIQGFRTEIEGFRKEIDGFRKEIHDFKSWVTEKINAIHIDMVNLENRLLIKLGVMIVGSITIASTIVSTIIALHH